VPPIYTLAFYNAIANGVLLRPYFVKALSRNGEDVEAFEPRILNEKICSDATLATIRTMLDSVVAHGTGSGALSKVVHISGKTGTAQLSKGTTGYQQGGKTHQVSFCGYFPSKKPKYSCIVVIREPKGEIPSGGKQAGGVFREIAERIYSQNLRLQPSRQDTAPGYAFPIPKAGKVKSLKEVFSAFNIPFSREVPEKTKWVQASTNENGLHMTSVEPRKWLVPNVANMGARDAVYLLGKAGLKVSISGRGKVVNQSIPPGSFFNRGQHISLTLK